MRYFFAVVVLLISIKASAQTSHGYRAGVGVFFAKNFMAGLQDNFRHKPQPNDKLSTYSNMVGPFVRYNISTGRFALFPQVSAGVGTKSSINYVLDWNTGQVTAKRSNKRTTEYLLTIGATYLLTPNVGIETLLDFDIKKKRPALELGLQFFLRKKVR